MEIYKRLREVQNELKAPKERLNKFGGYAYRSCEDILNAVKPLLEKYRLTLILTDDVVQIGDRFYVKATATLYYEEGEGVHNSAYAREPLQKKGADESQITGASSSYARKYALAGLLAIDSTEDADTEERPQEAPKEEKPQEQPKTTPKATQMQINILKELAEQQGRELDNEKIKALTIKQASDLIAKLKGVK